MFGSLRLSFAWLHTWFGLVLGFVLMVAFFFGSMSVFDREIDRWSLPATRIEPQPMPSFDKVLAVRFSEINEPDPTQRAEAAQRVSRPLPERLVAANWNAYTTHRDPVLNMYVGFEVPNSRLAEDEIYGFETIDPRDGSLLRKDQVPLGSGFFYPMHFSLHLEWKGLGYWIVGFAAMTMLAALVSGVVMHRKIFREFFTFRRDRNLLRGTLDLHNLTGVLALPFHFLWALSGLIIFAGIYFPIGDTMMRPVVEAHERDDSKASGLALKPSGVPGTLASVDAMMAEAKSRWAARGVPGEIGFLSVNHVGNSNAYVSIYRDSTDRVASAEAIHFDGSTGRVVYEQPPEGPITTVTSFLTGMHLQQFKHWTLRWLIFVGGIVSCVCIATGFIFFVEKRKQAHAKQGLTGARWVDALAVTTVTGMVVATLAMLVVNRVLPDSLSQRDLWEESTFWIAWLLALVHAAWRSAALREARVSKAWREQCWAIAVLAVTAVLLNALTTGDHLVRTIATGYWPVAGVDLMLLVSATVAALAARRLQRAPALATQSHNLAEAAESV